MTDRLLCLALLFKTNWRNRTIFWWVYLFCLTSRWGHYPDLFFSEPCWILSLICYEDQWADQWVNVVACTGNIFCAMWHFLLSTKDMSVRVSHVNQPNISDFCEGGFFGVLLWWLWMLLNCVFLHFKTVCSCKFYSNKEDVLFWAYTVKMIGVLIFFYLNPFFIYQRYIKV